MSTGPRLAPPWPLLVPAPGILREEPGPVLRALGPPGFPGHCLHLPRGLDVGSTPFPTKHCPPRPGQPHPCLGLGSGRALRSGSQAPLHPPCPTPGLPAQGSSTRAPSSSEAPAEALPPPALLQGPTVRSAPSDGFRPEACGGAGGWTWPPVPSLTPAWSAAPLASYVCPFCSSLRQVLPPAPSPAPARAPPVPFWGPPG